MPSIEGGVEKDCGWRTSLSTCFYNRTSEAQRLAKLTDRFPTVVLLGPRNVGKSELAAYTLLRVKNVNPIIVDARRRMVRTLVGGRLEPIEKRIADTVLRVLADRAGVGTLVDVLREAYETLRSDRYIVVDEVHLASRDPVRDLEALAKALRFYPEYRGWHLIATSSEGILLASRLTDRLDGYGARVLLIEPLEKRYMRELYEEYSHIHGCSVDFEMYWRLVGGFPGYLPDHCSMDRVELEEWIAERRDSLIAAVVEAARRANMDVQQACREVHRLLVEQSPISKPVDVVIAETLVERNIAYPKSLHLKPQLNVYRELASRWAKGGCVMPP